MVGALFAHAIDAPHMIYPQEVRDMANVVHGALIIADSAIPPDPVNHAIRVGSDCRHNSMSGSWNMVVGGFSGCNLTDESRALLLGDNTESPRGDGFVNFGNSVCFWRFTGLRAKCPAPVKGDRP